MSIQQTLPLLDLSSSVNKLDLQRGIRKWGAFRLLAPGITCAFSRCVPHGRDFFDSKNSEKIRIQGYSPFGAENIRGKTIIPKESVYFFRQCDQDTPSIAPPPELFGSATNILQEWRNLRDDVFEFLSKEVFGKSTAWAGTHLLDHETMGLHHYSPQRLVSGVCDYNPPHKDSGTLTILVREGNGPDGLEVADLDTTKEVDSARIGLEASFLAVPVAEYEVVVFFGTRSQRLLGKDVARACVHRVCSVRNGYSSAEERFSAAIFCAPPV